MGHLTDDAEISEQIRESQPHRIPAPPWVDHLDHFRVTRAALSTEPLGDSDNVMLEIALPGGGTGSIITLIDHNMASAAKDCFTAPVSIKEYERFTSATPTERCSPRSGWI